MATVNPTRDTNPAFPHPEGVVTHSAVIANGDDLVLPDLRRVVLLASPAAAPSTLNSLSNGVHAGDEAILMVVVAANTVVIPEALPNVDFGGAGNLVVQETANARLVWDGLVWRAV